MAAAGPGAAAQPPIQTSRARSGTPYSYVKTRLLNLWTKLHSTFWFVPSLMVVGALILSFVMIAVDQVTGADFTSNLSWLYTNKPEGARSVLSTIAGSMITVAGVVFSITIVALTLASSQFGPRLLGNFMRDTGNQVVLGTFIATFFFCLMILRTIRSGDETEFVPHLSVAVGVGLAVCSLGVLIYFIHHVAESIQASSIISRVDADYSLMLARLFPEKLGKDAVAEPEQVQDAFLNRACLPVHAIGAGYLQALDNDTLLKTSCKHDLIIKLLLKPGDYAVLEQPIAEVYVTRTCEKEVLEKVADCFFLGKERTLEQDLLFPVNQLVEIALRALSPSVNDPFTAAACINRLTNGLCELAVRKLPSGYRKDEAGQLRVVVQPVTFPEALEASFEQIRLYAKTNPRLMHFLLTCYLKIAGRLVREEDRQSLLHETDRTLRIALAEAPEEELREQLRQVHQQVTETLMPAS